MSHLDSKQLNDFLKSLPREELEDICVTALRQRDSYQTMIHDLKLSVISWLKEDDSTETALVKLKTILFGN